MDLILLDEAAKKAYAQLEQSGEDARLLPPVLQPVVLLYTFQAMVDNGGIRYPLENNFPGDPPYSVFIDAYRAIDAEEAADCIARAVAMLPGDRPELDPEGRNRFMDSLPEEAPFYALGDMVCGDQSVWSLMQAYVEAHRAEFGV